MATISERLQAFELAWKVGNEDAQEVLSLARAAMFAEEILAWAEGPQILPEYAPAPAEPDPETDPETITLSRKEYQELKRDALRWEEISRPDRVKQMLDGTWMIKMINFGAGKTLAEAVDNSIEIPF